MPCCEGHAPQQIDALLQLVTLGIRPLAWTNTPCEAHFFRVGIGVASKYSTPNPSHITTTVRCGRSAAKPALAEPANVAALSPYERKDRRVCSRMVSSL